MGKVIKLKESDIQRIVKRVLSEQENDISKLGDKGVWSGVSDEEKDKYVKMGQKEKIEYMKNMRPKKENELMSNSLTDSQVDVAVKQLHDSMEGLGTDEDLFWEITNKYKKCKPCIKRIKEKFNELYGDEGDLVEWIKGDIHIFGSSDLYHALNAWDSENRWNRNK